MGSSFLFTISSLANLQISKWFLAKEKNPKSEGALRLEHKETSRKELALGEIGMAQLLVQLEIKGGMGGK